MSDEQQWKAPSAPSSTPAQGAFSEQSAAFTPPPTAPGPAETAFGPNPSAPQPGPAAWTPPPKPGLVPLRQMDLSTILGAAFRTLRRNPRPTFGASILIQGIIWIVTNVALFLPWLLSIDRLSQLGNESSSDPVLAGLFASTFVNTAVAMLFGIVATSILQGIIVVEVARGTLGEKLPLRSLWQLMKGRILALIGWATISALAFAIAIGVVVVAAILLIASMGSAGTGLAIIVVIFGAIGLTVLGAWLGTKLGLVPSALVLERLKIVEAMRRSWQLTTGYFWRVFGITLLVAVILGFASSVITGPVSFIFTFITILIAPTGATVETVVVVQVIGWIVQSLIALVVTSITAIIQTAASALIYLDLRMRKEGLDIELIRYVERTSAGESGLGNPYLRTQQWNAA